jgi:hypothetical protein
MRSEGYFQMLLLVTVWVVSAGVAGAQVVTPETRHSNYLPVTNTPPLEEQKPDLAPGDVEAEGLFGAAVVFRLFQSVLEDARTRDRYRLSRPRQQELDVILDRLEASFAGSFEYHYARWLNNHLDTAMQFHLMEAYRLAPEQTLLLHDLVAFYELSNDTLHKTIYCHLMQEENIYDTLLYGYARNLFRSLPPGALLFTQGEWDTYPLWVLQHVHGERTDVTLLQLDLLHKEHYFNRVMKPFSLRRGAYQRFLSDKPAFFRELSEASRKNQVFLSLTLDHEILSASSNILYNTGLAMKLSKQPFNNMEVLAENWSTFDLTHLRAVPDNPELAKMMGNYIFPLALLHQQAMATGRNEEGLEFRRLMITLARNAGFERELGEHLINY